MDEEERKKRGARWRGRAGGMKVMSRKNRFIRVGSRALFSAYAVERAVSEQKRGKRGGRKRRGNGIGQWKISNVCIRLAVAPFHEARQRRRKPREGRFHELWLALRSCNATQPTSTLIALNNVARANLHTDGRRERGRGRAEKVAAGAQANRAVCDNSLAGRFFTAVRNRILLVERKSSVATKHGSLGGSGYVARSISTFHSTRRQQEWFFLTIGKRTFSIWIWKETSLPRDRSLALLNFVQSNRYRRFR